MGSLAARDAARATSKPTARPASTATARRLSPGVEPLAVPVASWRIMVAYVETNGTSTWVLRCKKKKEEEEEEEKKKKKEERKMMKKIYNLPKKNPPRPLVTTMDQPKHGDRSGQLVLGLGFGPALRWRPRR